MTKESSMNTVDARGLSCPQPVLDTLSAIAGQPSGSIEILVDTQASRENVCRAAQSKGWSVESDTEENNEYRIVITKG
jgi:TusA-related sulfurtransferase